MRTFRKLTLLMVTASVLSVSAKIKKVISYPADEKGFLVNSYILEGEESLFLIDAQFTISNAEKLLSEIKKTKKPLTQVWITHGHPDHYFGLSKIKSEYPKAKVSTTAAVREEIKKTGEKKLNYWRSVEAYRDDLPEKLEWPEETKSQTIDFEGERFQVMAFKGGESEAAAALLVPNRWMFAGDLLYANVHLWLADGNVKPWIANLRAIEKKKGLAVLYPGHGTALENQDLIADNKQYLAYFETVLQEAKQAKKPTTWATEKLKAQYKSYQLPVIAELSVAAHLK